MRINTPTGLQAIERNHKKKGIADPPLRLARMEIRDGRLWLILAEGGYHYYVPPERWTILDAAGEPLNPYSLSS